METAHWTKRSTTSRDAVRPLLCRSRIVSHLLTCKAVVERALCPTKDAFTATLSRREVGHWDLAGKGLCPRFQEFHICIVFGGETGHSFLRWMTEHVLWPQGLALLWWQYFLFSYVHLIPHKEWKISSSSRTPESKRISLTSCDW